MRELNIKAAVGNLEEVVGFVRGELSDGGCSTALIARMSIVTEEIFVNIANYAYEGDDGSVRISVAVGEEIVMVFEDEGVHYDPTLRDEPDTTLSAEEREVGGLGIFMVKSIMDSVRYRREDNRNILTVKKKMGG